LPRGPPRQGPFDTGEAALARLPALRGLAVPAVRSGRVVIIDDPLALTPSTHMAAFADQLAEVLGPWCAGR
jgi:ABC-type Fe3+-hydroxamate transport system substrate-binding protein